MRTSISSIRPAQSGQAVRPEMRKLLGLLDDQDFEILKTLEDEPIGLDAVEVAGTARLATKEVLEALGKLTELGLVSLEDGSPATEDSSPSFATRFILSDEQLSSLNE